MEGSTALDGADPAHSTAPIGWRLRLPEDRELHVGGRTLVMGIVNLTPDSFSDGGRFESPDDAVAAALEMLRDGADLLDLGAESTRPGGGVYGEGAREVPWQEEWRRLEPALRSLREATDAPLSVDTRKAAVARRALEAGADVVNDVSALADPDMAPLLAASEAPVVLMHSRGELATMQRGIAFDDVVAEVRGELGQAIAAAEDAGIDSGRIVVDPGLGFGKTRDQNLRLLAELPELRALGRPILVGASRKSFLRTRRDEPPAERIYGSLAAAAWAASRGADIVRVHDVAATVRLIETWRAIAAAGAGGDV
ncbi:MAG: dihydropteroate synthase [Thermoanaerobaculia bacterium]|nr:dihydropteroate synthase [Thermoanaerobaculia bacterium]